MMEYSTISIMVGVICLVMFAQTVLNLRAIVRYSTERGLINADRGTRLSAILLLLSGILCFLEEWRHLGCYGLALFLIMSAFTVHKFWDEPAGNIRQSEGLHFMKNLMFAALLIAIGVILFDG